MQYSDFQNQASSEKITLAIMSASKRLMGWSVYSGSVYQVPCTFAVIASIADSGTNYIQVDELGSVIAGSYFLDRSAQMLYLQTSDSVNPNGKYLAATFSLFFANVPIVLPYDLNTGFEVFWEPLIQSTSEFGVTIDTINQTSEAIEGDGTLTLNNDFDFWPKNFDKLVFENKPVLIYSYNRDLDPSDAQIIFNGAVLKKTYARDTITFDLRDQFIVLQNPVPLDTIGDIPGVRADSNSLTAFQRMIFGRVFGHVPMNIDQTMDSYPITGTVSIVPGNSIVNGTGTQFTVELSPNDKLILNGNQYTIASIQSDTQLTLSETFSETGSASGAVGVSPDQPKRWQNRIYKVAGHALCEPTTTTTSASTIIRLWVTSNANINVGDWIYVGTLGSGTLVKVKSLFGTTGIQLATSLAVPPTAGTTVFRPAVQNVRIDDTPLEYYRDYTFDAATATLTLRNTAEFNAGPVYQLNYQVTFTNGSRQVTCPGGFQATLKPGNMLGVAGEADFFEIMSVDSDTSLTLRTASTFGGIITDIGKFSSLVYDPQNSVLTLDTLGRTWDGTKTGDLIKTAPEISKALLTDAGLSSALDNASFTGAIDIAYQEIGIVVPTNYSDTSIPIYRDVMNTVNQSVFGTLVQTSDFLIGYEVLKPMKPVSGIRFSEMDFLTYSMTTTAENAACSVILNYAPREYDYLVKDTSTSVKQVTSQDGTFLVQTNNIKTFNSVLVSSDDALIMATRWTFLLQGAEGRLTFTTKLQGATLQIGDIISIEHRKFFERFGTTSRRKVLLVESVTRSGATVTVQCSDLSNTFSRVAAINDFTDTWATASDDGLLFGGYITDQYGLISNDPNSYATNLIW